MSELLNEDFDSLETQEWLESMEAVLENEGPERAHFLLEKLIDRARRGGTHLPFDATTAYVNTIAPGQEPNMPADQTIEARIRAAIRWNAMVLVLKSLEEEI